MLAAFLKFQAAESKKGPPLADPFQIKFDVNCLVVMSVVVFFFMVFFGY